MPTIRTSLFWIASLAVGLMSLRWLVLPMDLAMPNMAHFQTDAPLALIAHLTGGPLALLLAPFQLWSGLRARRPGVHRALGRIYGLAILIGALGSLALVPAFTGSSFAAAGFVALALLWLATTALGIRAARADVCRGDAAGDDGALDGGGLERQRDLSGHRLGLLAGQSGGDRSAALASPSVGLTAQALGLKQKTAAQRPPFLTGAGDEIRTHDPNLGKVMLYP